MPFRDVSAVFFVCFPSCYCGVYLGTSTISTKRKTQFIIEDISTSRRRCRATFTPYRLSSHLKKVLKAADKSWLGMRSSRHTLGAAASVGLAAALAAWALWSRRRAQSRLASQDGSVDLLATTQATWYVPVLPGWPLPS